MRSLFEEATERETPSLFDEVGEREKHGFVSFAADEEEKEEDKDNN